MSFFGFDTRDLEKERRRFLEGGLSDRADDEGSPGDTLAFNLGQNANEGLGDSLFEGVDELNDETFGGTGPVGE